MLSQQSTLSTLPTSRKSVPMLDMSSIFVDLFHPVVYRWLSNRGRRRRIRRERDSDQLDCHTHPRRGLEKMDTTLTTFPAARARGRSQPHPLLSRRIKRFPWIRVQSSYHPNGHNACNLYIINLIWHCVSG